MTDAERALAEALHIEFWREEPTGDLDHFSATRMLAALRASGWALVPAAPDMPGWDREAAVLATVEEVALGRAWRRVEAALPEGWSGPFVGRHVLGGCFASAASTRLIHAVIEETEGPTPAAALDALAERLEAR